MIVTAQSSALSTLLPFLEERLKDTAWEVRRASVDTLCTIIDRSFGEVEEKTIRLLAERTLDKRQEVRKYAMTGLVNVGNFYYYYLLFYRFSVFIYHPTGIKEKQFLGL